SRYSCALASQGAQNRGELARHLLWQGPERNVASLQLGPRVSQGLRAPILDHLGTSGFGYYEKLARGPAEYFGVRDAHQEDAAQDPQNKRL
ncbi:hypothetical protein GGI10_004765, partial [Coemansia sp. RSA 2530]